jgi:DNA-binding SARP family transcriptional activator
MHLILALLGGFEVRRGEQPVSEFRAQSARALLAYLALEAGRPHEREHLCALLWPDEPQPAALGSLRQALHRLRQALEPEGEEGRYLVITRQSVQLSAAVRSDVAAFDAALLEVAAHRHRSAEGCERCAGRLREALALYRGDLLPGFSLPAGEGFEAWLLAERERLHNALGGLLDRLAAFHERRGEHDAAVTLLRRWVRLDPWHERANVRLVAALAHSGLRTTALRQFERYRVILADDLGVEPGAAATRLVAEVRAGTLQPPAPAALRNAPAGVTPFVGRERELAGLVDRLNDPGCRLLTLTGPGGSGKTRLAIEAAGAARAGFADGAMFVQLAGAQHAGQASEALACALGVRLAPGRPPTEQLVDALREREQLLVLDTCEQVAGLGPLVAHLLAGAPGLAVLLTSRAPLDLRAEWVVPVGGLELPPPAEPRPDPRSYAAGQLLLQVAEQVRPALVAASVDAGLIYECCALLDGSPLAIELAAARLRDRGLDEVVAAVRANRGDLTAAMGAVLDWRQPPAPRLPASGALRRRVGGKAETHCPTRRKGRSAARQAARHGYAEGQ